MAHRHDTQTPGSDTPAEPGALIRWPRRYDLLVSFALAGRGGKVRSQVADALELRPGQDVLDVGCGTGTLTLTLAGRVGQEGSASGVDASPEMISAASKKAESKSMAIRFDVAAAQSLPFEGSTFDAVATSLMIHHLPQGDRIVALQEILRVLRPGGRLVIAEFQSPTNPVGRHLTEHVLGHAMASNELHDIQELATAAGVIDVRQSQTAAPWLGLVSGGRA